MTARADLVRTKRRAFAAPGSSHDRLIRMLVRVLPAGVGAVAAVMILAPFTPRGEISFLLDRNRVAVTSERLRVDQAMYRGADNQGRPFSLTAGSAVQRSASVPTVELNDLVARIMLADGPAEISARSGNYNITDERVGVAGPLNFLAADGYRMSASNVSIDLKTRRVVGTGGVTGTIPAGTFSAERIVADLAGRTVALDGRARLRMEPGKLRMP
ncbi:MAG: LPS export ABC transporter periplasmic protein LptC [Novosphingobium sp.]